MLEIIVLTPDDWPLWRQARLAALAEAPDAFGSKLSDWQGDGDREDRWRARVDLPGSYNLIAMRDGVPVAMASGIPGENPGTAELISMWVAPAARGQRVGDALVERVTDWAVAQGAGQLMLAVKAGNEPAIRLYRRHGFDFVPGAEIDADGELPMVRPLH
ncbi:MAG TPA: GNAT family N-acetyltransferase [Streptosporangiaceae bacterium]|nr:GNAT family N-acetyltransferase [Streptosporangiaceae bacterium]